MELRHIKELMGAMGRTGVSKLVLKKEGEYELLLERQGSEGAERINFPSGSSYDSDLSLSPLSQARSPERTFQTPSLAAPKAVEADEVGKFVTSPMVGTYYASPSPDDPYFVKPGDHVEANTVVCIIEAMKVMNEVKAGISGTIAEVLVNNGQPVEFGTKIFRIV